MQTMVNLQENPQSVVVDWLSRLPFQQQSVVLIAVRGPDGVEKYHPCKAVVRAYRATVLKAAYYGRALTLTDKADSFMDLLRFSTNLHWQEDVNAFFNCIDSLPHHYIMHLAHGAQIIGYKHPDAFFKMRWGDFYKRLAHELHLNVETEAEMDHRLCDWHQLHWG